MEVLGPTLSSLFLLVLVSAAMSSLDSVLLVAAASVGRDIMIIPDDDPRLLTRTRLWVFLISLFGMLLALNPFGSIVEITGFSGSLYAACFLPTLVLGMYWKRGTRTGALSCVICGALSVLVWYFAKLMGWTTWHEVYVGVSVAFTTYILVSIFTSSPENKVQSQEDQQVNFALKISTYTGSK